MFIRGIPHHPNIDFLLDFSGRDSWKTIELNQSTNRTQFDVTLWEIHKLFRYTFLTLLYEASQTVDGNTAAANNDNDSTDATEAPSAGTL
jgi:hypothetical protein